MSANPKKAAGDRAAGYVENGMIVGLGTGSTAMFAIRRLGKRLRAGLRIQGVPTSEQSRHLAEAEGIPLADLAVLDRVDVTIDGADEVDPAFNLIKGGGGALLREKIVASISSREIIVVDEDKLKNRLGDFPLPVEVVAFGWQILKKRLETLGCEARLRSSGQAPFVTDNGNLVLDCSFGEIEDPARLEQQVNGICGVVECGLFVGLAHRIVVGKSDGTCTELDRPGTAW
ncbi:MAG: ribose-5-phosphate isomerase RpiA [Candidatus Latescibacteria bacterium]|nr:ribose-5-phosphate isomerase RpiA [Candidatus Latescibacterota bacterium]